MTPPAPPTPPPTPAPPTKHKLTSRPRIDVASALRLAVPHVIALLIWFGIAGWLCDRAGPTPVHCSGASGFLDTLIQIGCMTQYLSMGRDGIIFVVFLCGSLALCIPYSAWFRRRYRGRL